MEPERNANWSNRAPEIRGGGLQTYSHITHTADQVAAIVAEQYAVKLAAREAVRHELSFSETSKVAAGDLSTVIRPAGR